MIPEPIVQVATGFFLNTYPSGSNESVQYLDSLMAQEVFSGRDERRMHSKRPC